MKCPIDATELMMSERQGVEIDYCPKCRGVWLDRGALDKIIERAEGTTAAPQATASSHREETYRGQRDYGGRDERHDHRRKKKSSILGELFDF